MLRVTRDTLNKSGHQTTHGLHVYLIWLYTTGTTHFIQHMTNIHAFGLKAIDKHLRSLL